MILAVRKSDGAVFENFGCDGLNPVSFLRDLSGKEFSVLEKDYKFVCEKDPKYNEYLKARV